MVMYEKGGGGGGRHQKDVFVRSALHGGEEGKCSLATCTCVVWNYANLRNAALG